MKGEAIIKTDRGRNIPGDGISEKCRSGRHEDCAAERCRCRCLHGEVPSLMEAFEGREIHVALPSGGTARVDPAIQPETLAALDEMMCAVVEQVDREVTSDHSGLNLERHRPSDNVTLAGVTASFIGRRGRARK